MYMWLYVIGREEVHAICSSYISTRIRNKSTVHAPRGIVTNLIDVSTGRGSNLTHLLKAYFRFRGSYSSLDKLNSCV